MKLVTLDSLQGVGGVLCHGVFDLVHAGHVDLFTRAAEYGPLTVTITADRFLTERLPGQPVYQQDVRAAMIAALECVQHVAIVEFFTALQAIATVKPSVYIKGNEGRRDELAIRDAEMAEVLKHCGMTVFLDKRLPHSTRALLSGEFLKRRVEYLGTATA